MRARVAHRPRDTRIRDLLRIFAIDEGEDFAWVALCQIYEERRLVVFKLNDSHGNVFVFFDDSVEEGHGWADPGHLVLVVFDCPVVPRVGGPTRVAERVDQRVQGLPDRD